LASDSDEVGSGEEENISQNGPEKNSSHIICSKDQNKRFNDSQYFFNSSRLINERNDQSDSNELLQPYMHVNEGIAINEEHIKFLIDNAEIYWKNIAREIQLDELQIVTIERNISIKNKLREVMNIWLNESCVKSQKENSQLKCRTILKVLAACRLNKIKGKFLSK
jgi:hypothetical protein